MAPLPVYTAADARWDCHSCGACCRGPEGVTVTADEAHAIEEHDWAAEGAGFRAGVVIARLDEASGVTRRRLRQVEGRCVFLDAERRCLVERRQGFEKKPLACRLFPLTFVEDADGRVEAVAGVECRSLWKSFEGGTPLESAREIALAALAPRRAFPPGPLFLAPGAPLAAVDAAALLEDLAAATSAAGPLADFPWRVAHPLKRALAGKIPPPYPFEGPPETPFYEALAVASEFLAPQARAHGFGRLAAGIEALRPWMGFRRAAERLEPAADRFVRATFRIFMRERRPLEFPDFLLGAGAALFAALAVMAGAARQGEVVRRGARGSAEDANEVAAEAARFLAAPGPRPIVVACREALVRAVLDAPAPGR